jgi:hypothetical protein
MIDPTHLFAPTGHGDNRFALRFTPAEWRALLEDRGFLADDDNRYLPPRRLMGVAVEIVPDHRFG